MLLIGAALGSLWAQLIGLLPTSTSPSAGSYALVGMAAATAASIHAPLTAAVLVFELSGDYLSRVVGQQLHDRQRGRGRRRPGASLTRLENTQRKRRIMKTLEGKRDCDLDRSDPEHWRSSQRRREVIDLHERARPASSEGTLILADRVVARPCVGADQCTARHATATLATAGGVESLRCSSWSCRGSYSRSPQRSSVDARATVRHDTLAFARSIRQHRQCGARGGQFNRVINGSCPWRLCGDDSLMQTASRLRRALRPLSLDPQFLVRPITSQGRHSCGYEQPSEERRSSLRP